jgi:hypothetical protein
MEFTFSSKPKSALVAPSIFKPVEPIKPTEIQIKKQAAKPVRYMHKHEIPVQDYFNHKLQLREQQT